MDIINLEILFYHNISHVLGVVEVMLIRLVGITIYLILTVIDIRDHGEKGVKVW